MFDDDTTELGLRQVYGGEKPALLSRADRRRHLYAIGKTGTGKTTLLERMVRLAGRGENPR
jgi:type IV secretory pathway ATPase VirB11/archaellum biosynthesis ATPase